jgi:hypothetical protein
MTEEEEAEQHQRVIQTIQSKYDKWINDAVIEFNTYRTEHDNKTLLQCLKQKYPHFKRHNINKNTNIQSVLPLITEFMVSNPDISGEHQSIYYHYVIDKIRGTYKHAQALKTGFCNREIINGLSEDDTISLCITKNTLEAGAQWVYRILNTLSEKYPETDIRKMVMIVSSKKNILGGNATHCKSIDVAWGYLKKRDSTFKIIFVCSNKTRLRDILQLTYDFQRLMGSSTALRIIHDEAHNAKEGINPFRDIVENIVMQPNVLTYMPVTATLGNIPDETNNIWLKNNLERNARNYTEFDSTKSVSPNYSSCGDATHHSFETLKKTGKWVDYNINEIPEEAFIAVYGNMDQHVIDTKRQLEFCMFMKVQCEIEAVNNGLNALRMNYILGEEFYQPNVFNIHIISTPCRKLVTYYIANEAIKMEYNPIVLAIFGNEGNKYHLMGSDIDEIEVSQIMGGGEFNMKLAKLLNHLGVVGINVKRPFIIIGNYIPTGESLTYVNYEYGTVRSNIRLISTNAEEDYQQACRINYMKQKFLEFNPDWIQPDKYLVGHNRFITNSLDYEAENDARIDNMTTIDDDGIIRPNELVEHELVVDSGGTIAPPVKIYFPDIMDTDIPEVVAIRTILAKSIRNKDDKKEFTRLLRKCIDDQSIDCTMHDKFKTDPIKQFKWTYELEDFRCYKKKGSPTKKGVWKFKNYKVHHTTTTPFMNNKNNHTRGQFEILTCLDKYVITDDTETIIEENSKIIWWIGFKY